MYTWRELVALYRLTDLAPPTKLQPRYSICPTTTIDAVIERDGKHALQQMRWSLASGWWNKTPTSEFRMSPGSDMKTGPVGGVVATLAALRTIRGKSSSRVTSTAHFTSGSAILTSEP